MANRVVFGEFRHEGPCTVALDEEWASLGIDEVSPVLGQDERKHRRRRCAVTRRTAVGLRAVEVRTVTDLGARGIGLRHPAIATGERD